MDFLARHDEAQRALRLGHCLPIAKVGEKHFSVGEVCVDFGEREDDPVTVGGSDNETRIGSVAAAFLREFGPGAFDKLCQRDTLERGFGAVFLTGFDRAARHGTKVGQSQLKRLVHFTAHDERGRIGLGREGERGQHE